MTILTSQRVVCTNGDLLRWDRVAGIRRLEEQHRLVAASE